MKREFYYQDDFSNKFWMIEVTGVWCVSSNGRVGSSPRVTKRQFQSQGEAESYMAKQIASKRRKGYVEGIPPEHETTDWGRLQMSEEVFWRIISLFNWKKLGDDDAVVRPAVKALAAMTVEDIYRFHDFMAAKLHELDTEQHAREIGEDAYVPDKHFSVDWFLYARCCVVANGREFFESVISTPAEMPKDMEFEAMLTVPDVAYALMTGNEYDYVSEICYETFSNQAGWTGRQELS